MLIAYHVGVADREATADYRRLELRHLCKCVGKDIISRTRCDIRNLFVIRALVAIIGADEHTGSACSCEVNKDVTEGDEATQDTSLCVTR